MSDEAEDEPMHEGTNGAAPGCPWSDWTPQSADLFCEARLCEPILTPANTWSNLPYIALGLVLVVWAVRAGRKEGSLVQSLQSLGWLSIAVGVGSFFFHASATFVGEVADVGAMFLLSTWALLANVERVWGRLSTAMHLGAYWLISLSFTAALVVLGGEGILLFTAEVTVVVLLELWLYRQHKTGRLPPVSYRPLFWLVVFFGLAFTAWTLDASKIWCDPDEHVVTGHALWHILNAPVYVLLFVFHRQLRRID